MSNTYQSLRISFRYIRSRYSVYTRKYCRSAKLLSTARNTKSANSYTVVGTGMQHVMRLVYNNGVVYPYVATPPRCIKGPLYFYALSANIRCSTGPRSIQLGFMLGFRYSASFPLLSALASSIIVSSPRSLRAFCTSVSELAEPGKTLKIDRTLKQVLYCLNKGSHSSDFAMPRTYSLFCISSR